MEPTNALVTMQTTADPSPCHRAAPGSGRWLGRWQSLAIAGIVIVLGGALALHQHWLVVADLVPLLFVLPCAAMMFACMRGMNHGQQTTATPSRSDTATLMDTPN